MVCSAKPNLTPLPPTTSDPSALPGATSDMVRLIDGFSAATDMSDDWDFVGPDGRLVRIRRDGRGPARAAYLLRLTLAGDQRLALDVRGTLWARPGRSWRPVSDLPGLFGEAGPGWTGLARAALERMGLPRLEAGVRFADVGFTPDGSVRPSDPRLAAPWALAVDAGYSGGHALRGLAVARSVAASEADARMLCRLVAAPAMRDRHAYDIADPTGDAALGFLRGLRRLYSDAAGGFSLAAFAGSGGPYSRVSRGQAGIVLKNRLVAVDAIAPTPDRGGSALVARAVAGGPVRTRLLGRPASVSAAVASIIIGTDRAPSEPLPHWRLVRLDPAGPTADRWLADCRSPIWPTCSWPAAHCGENRAGTAPRAPCPCGHSLPTAPRGKEPSWPM